MPHTDGPCSAAKYEATLWGSLLRIRLIAPWRYRCTSLERWLATLVKPMISKIGSRVLGVGDANSMNSKPIRPIGFRSEEHTSELQSLMRISYAVFCLKKKKCQQR